MKGSQQGLSCDRSIHSACCTIVNIYGCILQEALVRIDDFVGVLTEELEKAGIAENTLIILMADNGPMTHNGPPGMVETQYRGGKGDFTEGE